MTQCYDKIEYENSNDKFLRFDERRKMKMSWIDRILLSIFMWLGTRWFSISNVGYDANDNVVYIDFRKDYFDDVEVAFTRYERKDK